MLRQRATNGSSATKLGKDLNGRSDIRTHHGISRKSSKNKSRTCSSCLKLISFAAICAVLVMLGKGYYPFDQQNSEKVIQVKTHAKGKKSNTRGARKIDAPKKIDDKKVGKNENRDMKKTANDKENKPKHVSDMKNKVPKKSTDTHVGDVTTDNGTETADKRIGGNEKNMEKKSSDINVGDNKKNIPKSIDKHSTTNNKNNDPKKTTDKHIGGSGNNDSEKVIDKSHGAASLGKVFPSPFPEHDESSKYKVLLKPTFGKHRPDQNAVFAFAEGYELRIYITFIESLRKTSFNGDIVLSVSHLDKLKPGVEEYLRERSKDSHVIVYTVDWECFNNSGTPVPDSRGGVAHCKVDHMFGTSDGKSVEDPRIPRPVATARYDIYWVWALQYQPHSQILLIDVRDAYFQSDPFSGLKSSSKNTPSGILILYGENKVAVNIAKSKYNCNWIRGAYGTGVLAKISNHTISCSGSTIGEQVAIESYLRAMIQQFEETSCKIKGCDQGFHNYLFRMNLLEGAAGISKVIFHDQGEGNVNTLGAMREKPLTEWGILDKKGVVTNWDGSTSPVVHQFDRDQELNDLVNKKRRSWVKEWKDSKNK